MGLSKLNKLAIACGGTGGHFYPGLSIAREFQAQGGEVILLLSGKHSISQAEIAKKFEIKSIQIPSSPRSLKPLGLYKFVRDILFGTLKGRAFFKKFNPDAFLAMGSFASIPSALAARSSSIPLFLHEGNARIGKANILLSRWAKVLAIAFPPVNGEKSNAKIECIGMPVRPELLINKYSKSEAIESINRRYKTSFIESAPTLLVFGGSQGTQIFNEIIPTVLAKYPQRNVQVIHLTGVGKLDAVEAGYKDANCNHLILESSPDMDILYQASDTVICRSGGSTLAELSIFSKFAMLVPYPYSADGHQYDNARFQQSSGGALLVNNDDFTNETCASFINDWISSKDYYRDKGMKAGKLAKPHASREMLELIDSILANK